jgi:hypothetical protein
MAVRLKHVVDNLNKLVNNYWNRVVLDGNPSTWSNTRNRMQTPKSKNKGHITHNEYNAKKLKLSPYQAVEAYRAMRCQESHIV